MSLDQPPQPSDPYGPQGGFGQPQPGYGPPPPLPPGPPPGRSGGSGKAAVIVISAVLAIALVGGGVWYFLGTGSDGPELTDDGKNYELTAPRTVLGEFTLDNPGETDDDITYEQTKELGIKRAHAIDAEYDAGDVVDGVVAKDVNLSGVWGEVEDPQQAVDSAFALMTQGMGPDSEAEAVGSPERVEPEDLTDAVMKCQVIKWTNSQETRCVWADYSTIGIVSAKERDKEVTIDAAARIAADLRDEVRQEVK
ncbi:hypothetical protein [Streptomyces sp. NPDC018031]|uniref:hypothetical protein n=1 Tax=Streptomyces sp. NPDC018031 TaxID=3365033 RepID=UPI0037A0775D